MAKCASDGSKACNLAKHKDLARPANSPEFMETVPELDNTQWIQTEDLLRAWKEDITNWQRTFPTGALDLPSAHVYLQQRHSGELRPSGMSVTRCITDITEVFAYSRS